MTYTEELGKRDDGLGSGEDVESGCIGMIMNQSVKRK